MGKRILTCIGIFILVNLLLACLVAAALLGPSISNGVSEVNQAVNPAPTNFAPVTKWYTPAALQVQSPPTVDTFATISAHATEHAGYTPTPSPACIPFNQLSKQYLGKVICAYGYQGQRDHGYNASWRIWYNGHPVGVAARTPFPLDKTICNVVRGEVIEYEEGEIGISADYIGVCP